MGAATKWRPGRDCGRGREEAGHFPNFPAPLQVRNRVDIMPMLQQRQNIVYFLLAYVIGAPDPLPMMLLDLKVH